MTKANSNVEFEASLILLCEAARPTVQELAAAVSKVVAPNDLLRVASRLDEQAGFVVLVGLDVDQLRAKLDAYGFTASHDDMLAALNDAATVCPIDFDDERHYSHARIFLEENEKLSSKEAT